MEQLFFSFESSLCSGCHACVVACQDQNDLTGENVTFRHITTFEEGEYPNAKISWLSTACFHCGDAPCLMVCPAAAIFRREDTGVIDINTDRCVGCRSCALACPFGGPRFAEDEKMAKCDLCATRQAHAMMPACVRICPTSALTMAPIKDVSARKIEESSVKILESLIIG